MRVPCGAGSARALPRAARVCVCGRLTRERAARQVTREEGELPAVTGMAPVLAHLGAVEGDALLFRWGRKRGVCARARA
jgi:hypothetical protein